LSFEIFASLIRSGVPAVRAWQEASLQLDGRTQLLSLAQKLGAPLADVALLLSKLDKLDAEQRLEVEAAQAVPRLSSKLMFLLPPIGLVVGELLGLGNFAALATTPGLIAGFSGLALSYLATVFSARLVQRGLELPPLDETLLQLRLRLLSGQGVATAGEDLSAKAQELVALSMRTGAALGDLLQSAIEQQLIQRGLTAQRKAQELSVLLVLPLGLLSLPAFLLFALAPILIGMTQ
jgi:tight adherence protein B